MALNIEALRKKMQEVNSRRGGGNASFWSPKAGRNVIRILPAKEGQEFYAEARVRYNVGPDKKMVTVPLDSNKENCPIHEFVDSLFKTGDKEDEKLAKRMKASSRYYFNVIDRSLEEGDENYGKVQVFGCGTTIFTDILGIIVDPDYGDITDKDQGFDIIITKSGSGLDTEYKTNARPKQTPIGIDDWEEQLADLAKLATPKDYAKRAAILAGEDVKDDDDEESPSKKTESKQEKKQETKKPEPETKKPEPENTSSDADEEDIEAEIQRMLAGGGN